ncbi:protein SLOW GREEN 1, chloroplastic-like [Tasmannia lanceolata]|uniref:protein SLOW GREEN 1, chloroplastic-like n=1 Tax=Tasmannia lanceolata TaxID=3420 RepID=UPI004063CE35
MEGLGKMQLSLPCLSLSKSQTYSPFFLKTHFSKPPIKIKTSVKSFHLFSPKNPSSPFPFQPHHNPHPKKTLKPLSFHHPNPKKTLTLKPFSFLVKSIPIAIVTTALIFSRFQKPSLAIPISQPTVESKTLEDETLETLTETQKEKILQEHLDSHPDDEKTLKSLMEVKIKLHKVSEAIEIIDRLIVLQPSENEWPLLKAHTHLYAGDLETAKLGFEEIISNDPFRVEAYHGLVIATAQSESDNLEDLLKRIESVMERCKKEKKEDLRDFKLLVAQMKVIEGKYDEALNMYQQLVKEEPRDFRPYLCQGIIYTLLRKKDEAEKAFQKYRRLVPKGHPYAQYFNDNVLATKVFSQLGENQKSGSKR